jgi:hypothetical protein
MLFLAMATACMAAATTHFVSVEMIKGHVSTSRKWTTVAVMWIEVVINVAVETGDAVEPWAGSEEDTAVEPLGAVVPVWGAVIWCVVEIAIRSDRCRSNIDRDLGKCRAGEAQQSSHQGGKGKNFPAFISKILLPALDRTESDRLRRKFSECAILPMNFCA